jgi:hypothetical protein
MLEFSEQMLIAGFKSRYGNECDVKALLRQWYAEQMEEHDRMIERMLLRMARRGEAA